MKPSKKLDKRRGPKLPHLVESPIAKKSDACKPRRENDQVERLTTFEFAPQKSNATTGGGARDEFAAHCVIAAINARYGHLYFSKACVLVELATGLIEEIERLAKEEPRGVRMVAEERYTWPVLSGRHTAILKKNKEFFDTLKLGKEAHPYLDTKTVPIGDNPAKKYAIELVHIVEVIRFQIVCSEFIERGRKPEEMGRKEQKYLCSHIPDEFPKTLFPKLQVSWPLVFEIGLLPLLTPDAAVLKQWQSATWKLVQLNTAADPAKHPMLCGLGEHRRYHPYPVNVPVEDKQKWVSLKSRWNNVWREVRTIIFDQIRQTAEHIAKLTKTAG